MVDTPLDTAAEQAVTPSAEDEFSKAFAQYAAPGEKPAAETAPPTEPEAQQSPPADATEEGGAAPAEVTADSGDMGGEPVPTPSEPAPEPEPEPVKLTAEEWFKQYAAEQFARQQQAQYAQQQQPVPQSAPAPERSEPPPVLSKAEVETLQEFKKEWPDVAAAMEVQQKQFAYQLLDYVFGQIAQEVTPRLEVVDQLADRSHATDIYDFVPDYDQVRDPVINWVSQLPPSAFRNYAAGVVNEGSPQDIQGLVDQWRMFTGAAPAPQQAPVPAQRAPAPPPKKQADPALQRAAAAMAPVKSQRTTVVQTDDPNDFDGAFERYAEQMRRQRNSFGARQ